MKASKKNRTWFPGLVDNSEILLKWHIVFQNMKIIFCWKTGTPFKCIFWALIGRFWPIVLEMYYWLYHTSFLYEKETTPPQTPPPPTNPKPQNYFSGIFMEKSEILISRTDKIWQITVRLRKYKLYKFLLETSRLAWKVYGTKSALSWGCSNIE